MQDLAALAAAALLPGVTIADDSGDNEDIEVLDSAAPAGERLDFPLASLRLYMLRLRYPLSRKNTFDATMIAS